MSAIFISYTGRDPEGDAWADQLTEWFQEWNYGYFRDKDHSHGVKAGDDWRQTLFSELADARALVCLCSKQYDSSPWCVGEVAIAVKDGKTVVPILLATPAADLKSEPLPLLLQTRQAIKVADAANPSSGQLSEVKQRLQATLQEKLNWRDLQHWDQGLAPYPGLPAFEAHQAPVFFGQDKAIEEVMERLAGLALRAPAFLLLLGASGYGKSSLVRAGVVPRLQGDSDRSWVVLPPFTPGDAPFKELAAAVVEAGSAFNASDPLSSLQELQRMQKAPVVLVIDQFEELLTAGPKVEDEEDQGEVFQRFLLQLLRARKAGLMVLATMRTDFLAPLQTRWPALTGMASTYTLEPIEPEDFGVLITGPADRSRLTLEPGLEARLVKESGGRDALPLLAFTLEKLWKARDGQVLTLKAYADLGGVEGTVSTRADECWNPQTSTDGVRQAMRQAFLEHLVSVGSDGREAKRPAPLAELPIESREIVQRMVDDRLLVQKDGIVEIAHEALLRTWKPLKQWIAESKEELLQCLRVKRLADDLKPEAPERQRRQALEQLTALAAAGGSETRAVQKEGTTTLSQLLVSDAYPLEEREDAALVLALIGAEAQLRNCIFYIDAPVALRRRAVECLGLLARRCPLTTPQAIDQRKRIMTELEGWLRSDALKLRVTDAATWAEHDARLPLLQGASRGLQLAASADLPLLGCGAGRVVPMLTLIALVEGKGLKICTEVVDVPVWRLPLPGGEQLELVAVPCGEYMIGSPVEPQSEAGRDRYTQFRKACDGVNVEAQRWVDVHRLLFVRHHITQSQWQAVATLPEQTHSIPENPYTYAAKDLWELYAQPSGLPVDSVNWHDCQEWLLRYNNWLQANWPKLGGDGEAHRLALPSESLWEVACRAGESTPFHFGDTIDASWANYNGANIYGLGRQGQYRKRPVPVGFFGIVNRWGLMETHGQMVEWCADLWNPNPQTGIVDDGTPRETPEPKLYGNQEQSYRVLRGGSWISYADNCRCALRLSNLPIVDETFVSFRPCAYLSSLQDSTLENY